MKIYMKEYIPYLFFIKILLNLLFLIFTETIEIFLIFYIHNLYFIFLDTVVMLTIS